jgi:chemotaxis protein MotB
MRLTDQTGKPKGVFTMDPGGEQEGNEHGSTKADKKGKPRSDKAAEKAKKAETALLSNASEELDTIAAEAHKAAADLSSADKGPELAHSGGESYRDPFDPDSRYLAHPGEAGSKAGAKDGAADAEAKDGASNAQRDPSQPQPGSEADAKDEAAAAELQQPIEEVIKQSGFYPIPGVEVRSTEQGLLIAITDQPNFEMFGISSARPKPELVVLMEKIGKILVDRPEHLVIRGHTDGRRYKPGGYDNWRLSTARAQMAYYMLVRGGIAEARVERIEGHADHDLKVVDKPLAAENRRIEILLLKDKS